MASLSLNNLHEKAAGNGLVLGCGIDIEEYGRFERFIPIKDDIPELCRMVFRESELDNHLEINNKFTVSVAFSCKEAVFKAFGKSWTNSEISWKDIEIIFNDPMDLTDYSVRLNGIAKKWFEEMGCLRLESSYREMVDHIIVEVLLLG